MHTYELMLIVRPDLEMNDAKAHDLVQKLMEKVGGKLASVTVWGKRTLAYPIKKATEGIYVLATVEGSVRSSDVEKEVRMRSDMLRFLLTAK